MGAQLVFALCRKYGISVAVLWYILVKLLVKLIVSKCVVEAETTVSRKSSTWSKCNKDGNKIKLQ